MKPPVASPGGQREPEDVFDYYLVIDAELAIAFNEHFTGYRDQICKDPERFSLRIPPIRRVNLTPRFQAYYIAYMIWRGTVVILAVAHGKRRPYYWRKRISEAKKVI